MALPKPVAGMVIRYGFLWREEAARGLDDQRSWIALTDANRFIWPGPDLRPLPGQDMSSVEIGLLPRSLYNEVRDRFLAALRERRAGTVGRSS